MSKSNHIETDGQVLRIPFGGRVLLSSGRYDYEGNPSKGSLLISWMDHPEEIGTVLDETILERSRPLVELIFSDPDSIDTLIEQLLLVECTIVDSSTDPLSKLEEHSAGIARRVVERIAELQKTK